jgi:rhodanese-related sulfurtransferase
VSVAQILYPRLRELIDADAQLVEVLPEQEYAEEHLPGAINLPLKTLDARSAETLDRTRAVVVYCWDGL